MAALGALATVIGARHLGLPRRDALVLFGVTTDLSVVWARFSTSNTGFVDSQLTTRLLLLSPGSSPMEHRAMGGPAEIGPDGVAAGTDGLERTASGWAARVGGDGLAARISVFGADTACPPAVGAMGGMVEDKSAGELLDGVGFVFRTHATGRVAGDALYVAGPGFAAAIDPLSDCPAWVRAGAETWSGDPPAVPTANGSTARLGAWTLRVHAIGIAQTDDTLAHLSDPERWVVGALGFPAPTLRAARTIVLVEGPGVIGARAGLLLTRG